MPSLLSRHDAVTVWGLGKEGQAVLDFLAGHYPDVKATVVSDPLTVPLKGLVVKSPGVSLYRPEIRDNKNIVLTSGTNVFLEEIIGWDNRPVTVAVTGTKGKSTTSSLLAHLLRAAGKKVVFGGNIGAPLLSLIDDAKAADYVVAELSSYQCADLKSGFDLAVLLNLYPEHLDWHGSHQQYFSDKINLLRRSKKVILNAEDPETLKLCQNLPNVVSRFGDRAGYHVRDSSLFKGNEKILSLKETPFYGEHNLKNLSAVLAALSILGERFVPEALASFQPLPHRLQNLGEKDGIHYIDDSISTTPETTIEALKAFRDKTVVLIAGGHDRGQDYRALASYIREHEAAIRAVVTLPATGPRLFSLLERNAFQAKSLEDAFSILKTKTRTGDYVLLSPGAPSYGVYKNFEERGGHFRTLAGLNKN